MKMCDCYREKTKMVPVYFGYTEKKYGICIGTKECDECSCGGDESKCDFYPEKRKESKKTMNTVEMWTKAQEDGKMYVCINGDIAYSKETGLIDRDNSTTWKLSSWDCFGKDALDKLFGEPKWEQVKAMTKEEIEKEFGIMIIG